MSVIAVINRKGGCGKSTLACHLAVWLAQRVSSTGSVMLADVDLQHTLTQWLQRRRQRSPGTPLQGWVTDARNVMRPPRGVVHSVLDSPGGLRGFELARLLVFADVVILPVCDSAFDLDAATACLAELRSHPRVASGRVQLALVGMRVTPGSASSLALTAWATAQGVAYAGAIRASEAYVGCAASGLTLFDAEVTGYPEERSDWQPVLQWLESALRASAVLPTTVPAHPVPLPARPTGTRGPAAGQHEAPASRFGVASLDALPPAAPPAPMVRLWRRLRALAAGATAPRPQQPV